MSKRLIAGVAATGVLAAVAAGATVNHVRNDEPKACTKPITFINVDDQEARDTIGYYVRDNIAGGPDFPKAGFEFDWSINDAPVVEPERIVATIVVYDATRQFIYDVKMTRSCVEDGWVVTKFERPGAPAAQSGGTAVPANPDK